MSAKEKLPSDFSATAGSALPLGDSMSVRVTVAFAPAGNAPSDFTRPVTVSFLLSADFAGALTVTVLADFTASVSTRSERTPRLFAVTANSLLVSGAQARPASIRVSAPLLFPVLGNSYVRTGFVVLPGL